MNLTVNLDFILQLVAVAGIIGLFRGLWSINIHLTKINGRITESEVRMDAHAVLDAERHRVTDRDVQDIKDRANEKTG